jgi:hypothetical protein
VCGVAVEEGGGRGFEPWRPRIIATLREKWCDLQLATGTGGWLASGVSSHDSCF